MQERAVVILPPQCSPGPAAVDVVTVVVDVTCPVAVLVVVVVVDVVVTAGVEVAGTGTVLTVVGSTGTEVRSSAYQPMPRIISTTRIARSATVSVFMVTV